MTEWRFAEKPIGETTVKKIEKALDIKFPSDYVTTILNNNGARPSKKIFDFKNTKGAVFNRLHGLTEDSSSFILEVLEDYQDGRILPGIVPFACDPFGNEICFDYRLNKENPSVVFWDHEIAYEDPDKALSHICNSFTELVNKLYEE
ncbi:cell wall assembly regulator SMI1 [Bacillus atrophaeus]|nr:SMI1/KNR4 family protein [Bacillus atrophaeus]MDQ0928540.1 cell wall assembly regulator SMI1 [Bacillus atrophaeus]